MRTSIAVERESDKGRYDTVLLAVLLAAAMALVSAWFWRLGLRRYGSASS